MASSPSTSKLPARVGLAEGAWSDYDKAWSLLTRDDAGARGVFEQACVRFEAAGDTEGVACVAAGALVSIASRHADFRGLGQWLGRFEGATPPADATRALRFHGARLSRPSLDSRVGLTAPEVIERGAAAFALLRAPGLDVPADERLLHGKLLLDWLNLNNDQERFEDVASLLSTTVSDPRASPYWVAIWWCRLALSYGKFGQEEAARTCLERTWQIARNEGLADLQYALPVKSCWSTCARGTSLRPVTRWRECAASPRPSTRPGRGTA